MKKKYVTPNMEIVKTHATQQLLAGSVYQNTDAAEEMNSGEFG